MTAIRAYFVLLWNDLHALPLKLIHDYETLAIFFLVVLPWVVQFIYKRDIKSLEALLWIFGLIAFYWLVSRGRETVLFQARFPRLEFVIAMVLAALWALYRVGEYWHWYSVPSFGLTANSCTGLGQTAVPKMLEMFLVPFIILFVLKYSFGQMGFAWDKFPWLAAIIPLAAWIIYGLTNHAWKPLAFSSFCYFFAAGMPEEFLFRAFLQMRLEAMLKRPVLAAWIAAVIFGLSHIPINLGGSFTNWPDALLTAFTYQLSVGFALGYAYIRARDIMPLALLHTFIDSAV
jgi:membrane protease YdiL (CAAX protease family)